MARDDPYERGRRGESVFGQQYTSVLDGVAHADGQNARDAANRASSSGGFGSSSSAAPPPVVVYGDNNHRYRSASARGAPHTKIHIARSFGERAARGVIVFLLGFIAVVIVVGTASEIARKGEPRNSGVRYVAVNTINLNLRAGPGVGYAVVAVMPQGLKAKIVGHSNGWVELDDVQGTSGQSFHGFAHGDYLKSLDYK